MKYIALRYDRNNALDKVEFMDDLDSIEVFREIMAYSICSIKDSIVSNGFSIFQHSYRYHIICEVDRIPTTMEKYSTSIISHMLKESFDDIRKHIRENSINNILN